MQGGAQAAMGVQHPARKGLGNTPAPAEWGELKILKLDFNKTNRKVMYIMGVDSILGEGRELSSAPQGGQLARI